MINYLDLLKKGGSWLGVVRNWIQCKKINGERVIWGSNDVLQPEVTVKEVEEIAAISAAAVFNSIKKIYIVGKKTIKTDEASKIVDIYAIVLTHREAMNFMLNYMSTKGIELEIISFDVEYKVD